MRLFVAIDLDGDARDAIERLQQRLAGRLTRDRAPRWVDSSHMHLTLVFLGEVAEGLVPPIVESLSRPVDTPPFVIALQGLGVFPPRGAPRVLWLGVSAGADALATVQGQVATRLEWLGVTLERRRFHPHLTLARWRDSRPSDRSRALAPRVDESTITLAVNSITLYQSRLSSAGSTYTALARATLT